METIRTNRGVNRIEHSGHGVTTIRSGGGIFKTVGGIFLLAIGVYLLIKGEILFSLAFLIPGALIGFSRYSCTIDSGEGRISTSWGLLIPFKSTTRALAEFQRVAIGGELGGGTASHRGRRVPDFRHTVRLTGEGEPVDFGWTRDPGTARRLGEALAKATGLPLEDGTQKGQWASI